ncbi:MAG: hypothetical protein AB7O66_20240 [Limisphaerales bacterium]
MKKAFLIALFAALGLGTASVQAKDVAAERVAVKALSTVPTAELPATAAKLVTETPKDARAQRVAAVIQKVARTNPSALRHVVASVAKADSSVAALAAGLAAKAQRESTAEIAAAACGAAPEKAAEILAVCSVVTSFKSSEIAQMVSTIDPAFAAATIAQQAEAVDVTASAAAIRGGTVILPIPVPGAVGSTIAGDTVLTAPTPIGPGRPGFDPDRYARGGR